MGLNPMPRWGAAFLAPLLLLVAIVGLTMDAKTTAQESKDKKEAPKDAPAKKIEIDASKVIVIQVKNAKDFVVYSTLPVEALESRFTKEKNKTEALKDGGVLVRGDGAPYILQDGGDSKIYLMMGGVRIKYTEVRVPSGYYVTFK